MKTKLFTLLLAVAASVGTLFASNTQVDGIYYEFSSTSKFATVTYRGSSYSSYSNEYNGTVTIPASVTYNGTTYRVEYIGEGAFQSCSNLTSVTIPNSVRGIEKNAFKDCSGLTSVTLNSDDIARKVYTFDTNFKSIFGSQVKEYIIGNNVGGIGDYAFYECTGLTSLTIPNSVTSIGRWTFYECTGLTSVTIGNSVRSIGEYAFYYCTSLTSVTIPNSVTSIGSRAFNGCTGLTSLTIGNSVTSIGEHAFLGCNGLASIVVQEGGLKYDSRESCNALIESSTNRLVLGCKNSIIPNSVTSIGSRAFNGCTGLTSLTIPNSVTSIGDSAFYNCTGLTSMTIPNSVTSIGGWIFYNCTGLASVTIGNGVKRIGTRAFFNCKGLISVTIPNSVTTIGDYAFQYCTGLTSMTIPNSVSSIGGWAFENVPNIVYSGSATGSPWGARKINGYVDGYLVYNDVNKTGLCACSSCAQGEIIIPDSVTSIWSYAFYNCSSIRKITFGKNISFIGNNALKGCGALNTIVWNVKNYTISSSDNTPFRYYNSSSTSNNFDIRSQIKSFTFGANVETIPAYLCNGMTGITTTVIPESVTSIETEAFYACSSNKIVINFSALDIVKGATSHGYVAFYASDVSSETDTIGDFVFAKCDGKDYAVTYLGHDCQITLPANYRGETYGIAANLFRYNTSVNSITISNAVTSIGESAFNGCSNLNVVYIGNSVISIGTEAFYNCPQLYKVIMLPNSVPDGINSAFQTLSGRITYVGNANYQSGYDVLGTQRVYSNLNSYFTVDGIVYALVNPSMRTCDIVDCDYSGATTEFSIGNSVVYKKITLSIDSINSNAFRNNQKMIKLAIDGNHALPSYMAYGCTSLDTLAITTNVGHIGFLAFGNCSQNANAYYTINNNGNIGNSAFYNCGKLNRLIVGDSVKDIGSYAFWNCYGLEDVTIRNKGDIGTQAFRQSSTQNPATYIINNGGSIGNSAFADCSSITNLTIDTCVTTIGDNAFQNCYGLEDVTIRNKGNIGTQAFDGSSTQNPATYLVQNAGQIGESAFANCISMTNLTVDSCVTTIGTNAFQKCISLENVTIKNNGDINTQAFNGSSTLNPATYIINNVGSIGNSAFADCSLMTNLSIDSCVTNIENNAFQSCSRLKEVTIKNRGDIGTQAFAGSSTQNPATYIINNIGQIGESAFTNCTSMTNLTIDTCVTTIGNTAFQNCRSLEEAFIQNKGSIGEYAFANCSKLQKARFGNQISSINQSAFKNCVLFDSITMPNTITALGDSAFYNCAKLAYAKLSNQLISIGQSAFASCSSLPDLFIPKSVTSIGNGTFKGCSALSVVGFEDGSAPLSLGINTTNQGLFYECPLDSLYIGRELTYTQTASDGYSPFYRNSSLRSIVISDFPTKVETNEFYGCTKLYSVYIGNGVQSIGDYAFSGCSSIDYFSFGNQVQTIGAEAFSDCVAMTRLYSYCQVPPTCGASALADIDKWNCTLYIPKNTINDYAAANQWMDFFFIEENEEGGEGIQYTISVDFDATKGTVTGAGVYNIGTEVILTATPAEGCTFVEWEDGSTNPERHIYAYKSEIYTATFSAPNYELYNGNDIAVTGESVLNNIEIDQVSYPNAIAYSYSTTTDINLPDNICGQNNEGDWYADNIVLTDAQPFYAPYDVEAKHLSYARTFENDQWQALYVPFDMQYADFSSKARIAYVNNVHQYDDDDNGVIDRTVIEFISVVNDDIKANWPYIVKPNTAGAMTFNVANTTLHATEENDVECQSAFTRFNIIGTYQNTPIINKYIVHNSEFELCESLQTVSPFRIYLVVTNKYPTSPQPAPMRITFMIDGREEPTPTDVEVLFENDSTGEFYDVLGRPVSRPSHGVFIRNGEKILVK